MPESTPATRQRADAPGARVAVLGEVLFDCFPDGPRLGGAPFNVAWHLAGFGLAPAFVSRIGADPLGADIRRAMAAHGMHLATLQEDPKHPTGQVRVTLDGKGGHAFEILPDQAYDHIEAEPVLAHLARRPPELVCYGTLCLRAPASRAAILAAVAACPGVRLLDVNLRPDCWTDETLGLALEAATVAKLNEYELNVLTRRLLADAAAGPEEAARAEALRRTFDLDAVCVTRGAEGVLWCDAAGRREAPAPPAQIVDTVGAGDAFTAVLITGLLEGWAPDATLARAAAFAAEICGMRGACPEDPAFYARVRAGWG